MDGTYSMCGIAGFSRPEGSKRNARHLAHHLLTQIENRGSHASGFAYITANGKVGIYKNPTPGSQLSLHELPRDARTVILHTRYATQGAVEDNRNNHPVISTDRKIALVHNGVINNDHLLRADLGITAQHGEVDSLVIPSIIAQHGVEALSRLSGYAAIAWLSADSPGELFIARLKSSPVAYTHMFDGSFVFASQPSLLMKALIDAGEYHGGVFDLAEGRTLTVQDGFIMEHDKAPSMSFSQSAWMRHSTATSGGTKASAGNVTPIRGSESQLPRVLIPEADDDETVDIDGYYADLERWREQQNARDVAIGEKALAMLEGPNSTWDDGAWEDYTRQLEEREEQERAEAEHASCTVPGNEAGYGEGFYILDAEGDISHYSDLEKLESQLAWLAGMRRTDNDLFQVEDNINWVNHIMDLGHVDEDGNIISWIDDTGEIDEFESPAVRNLAYIREGAQRLTTLKGA